MKLKDIDSSYLKRITEGYQWLPGEKFDLGPNLSHSSCPRWRNPVMAPVLLLKRQVKADDLRRIEAHVQKFPKRYPYDAAAPYLLLYDLPFYDQAANKRVFSKESWTETPRDLFLNIWNKPEKVVLPKGFEVTHGRYSNPRLLRDFHKMSKASFGATPEFLKDLDFLHRKIEANLTITVIYEKSKTPVAAGLAFTKGQTTFLYCGSVIKNRRNKGLWKLLVAARQGISNSGENHMWMLSSQHEHIREKGELSFRMRIWNKTDAKKG